MCKHHEFSIISFCCQHHSCQHIYLHAKSFHSRYTAPDGSLIEVTYVANEDGFQPEGDHLPIAPEFPHEIPEFVLRQIAKAAEEDALAAAETRDAAPSQLYQRPQ